MSIILYSDGVGRVSRGGDEEEIRLMIGYEEGEIVVVVIVVEVEVEVEE